MSAPIIAQANAVLNSYNEGTVAGLIMAFEKIKPDCTNKEITEFLKKFNIQELDYWIKWFSLDC